MTQKNFKVVSNRSLVIVVIFAVGLVIGVIAVIAIQSVVLKRELEPYDIANIEDEQDSTKRSMAFKPFEEIFKLRRAEQHKALYNTLSHATEQELKGWWTQSQNLERNSHREIAQQVILRFLTKINPQEALHLLDDVSTLHWYALSQTIFSEWAVLNLEEAIQTVAKLEGIKRNVALEAIFETRDDLSDDRRLAIAVQLDRAGTYHQLSSDTKALHDIANPSESWDTLLNDSVDDSLQIGAFALVAEAWRVQIGVEVFSKIYHSRIEDHEIKRLLAAAIAQVDPVLALEYAQGVSEENERSYISHIIVEEWASTDPLAALAAVSSFKPTSLYFDLEEDIALVWAKNKPYELIQSIELMSERSRVWPLEVAFAYIAREDPLGAIDSLSSIEDYVGSTTSILHRIVDQWAVLQPEAAINWLLNDFDSEDPILLHSILEDTLPSLARQNPQKAFDIALAHPTPSRGLVSPLDRTIIWQLTIHGDIEQAISLLPRVRIGSKFSAYDIVGSALVRKGQTLEAWELGTDLDPKQQHSYYLQVIQEWARTDPINLYESLEDLPASDDQSFLSIAALELLTRRFNYRQRLTDDQLKRARSFLNADDKKRLESIEKFENL